MYNNLMDNIIKKFGFEDVRTICFCQLCENVEKNILKEDNNLNITKFYFLLINEED